MFLQETYALQDCIKYDDATSDKSSSYTKLSNAQLSFDSANNQYVAYNNGGTTFECIVLPLSNLPSDISMELEARILSNGSNRQPRFGFSTNNSSGYYIGLCQIGGSDAFLKNYNGSDNVISSTLTSPINLNTWFKVKITYDGSTLTGYRYDSNGDLIDSVSATVTAPPVGVAIGLVASNNRINFKNLKIKPL